MAWEKEVAYLDEKNAHLVKYTDTPLLFRRELVRGWPKETDALMVSAIEYLNQFATAANGTTPTARQYVDDPRLLIKGGLQTYAGRWRVVHNAKTTYENEAQIQEQSGILQTLRYGLARTLEWDEVRILNNKQSPGNTSDVTTMDGTIADTASDSPEDFMLLEFVNLDPDYTRSMLNSLTDTIDFNSPIYRYGVYPYAAGSWHKVAATILESELEDGSARIQVLLARPQYTLEAYKEYISLFSGNTREAKVFYLWNVPKTLAQTIIDTFKAPGRSVTCSYGSGDNLVNMTLTDFYQDGALYMDVGTILLNCSTVETAIDIFGVYDPTDPIYDLWGNTLAQDPGYTLSRDVRLDRETGLFDISMRIRHILARNYGWRESDTSETQYARQYQQFGIPDDAALINIYDMEQQGLIYDQNVSINADCTKDAATRAIISRPLEMYNPWVDTAGITVQYLYLNQRTARVLTTDVSHDITGNTSINADGTYNQNFTIKPLRINYSFNPEETEWIESAYEVIVPGESSVPFVRWLRVETIKKFTNAHDAAAYAGDGSTEIPDEKHGIDIRTGAFIEHKGRDLWYAHKVTYLAVPGTPHVWTL